jgi:hypothetical protein
MLPSLYRPSDRFSGLFGDLIAAEGGIRLARA